LFLEYFITCPACYLNGRDANSSLHHSLLQVSAHSRDETVKDFTVHEKCCRKHPTPGNTSGNRTTSCRATRQIMPPRNQALPAIAAELTADRGSVPIHYVGDLALVMSGFHKDGNLIPFVSGEMCVGHSRQL
jgi:hypothetical protein